MFSLKRKIRALKKRLLKRWLNQQIPRDPELQNCAHDQLIDELLKEDTDFNIEKVLEGFADRPSIAKGDKQLVARVCNAYEKAKAHQTHAGPEFKESDIWMPIYKSVLSPVITALKNKDNESVTRIYRNFWRDACSTGLVGFPVDMHSRFFNGMIANKDAQMAMRDYFWRLRLWRELVPDTELTELRSPDIGNPYGYYIGDIFLRGGCDYHHYYATQIRRIMRNDDPKIVCEVGGGFGGMAYYLIRDMPNLTYIDVDLPENMALTAYYLLTAFPDRKIALYGEFDTENVNFTEFDAIILPSFAITTLPSGSVDLMFNSYSMAEMSLETVNMFVSEFARVVKSYVFHVNHNRVSSVKADEFGIDRNGFSLLYKTPALWNFARDWRSDEFEYLYRRDCRLK